jgi:hypothetical protein
MAEARGQFGNQVERERPLLEAGTRGLVKRKQTKESQCILL